MNDPERRTPIRHHFSVDVEEYFNFLGFERRVPRDRWDGLESRVESSVDKVLDMLDAAGSTGTFFTLGWIAERHTGMVRRIVDRGHEMASHGYSHTRVVELGPERFREEIRTTKRILEDITGVRVTGFRSPHFSILPGCEWALDILLEEGYEYDSSLFPVRRRGYGYPTAGRDPHVIARPSGDLVEIPPATLRIAGLNLPAGGGAYFRIFPYSLLHQALRACERRSVPGTFYIHPWELDPDQPPLDIPRRDGWKHYMGLARTEPRMNRMLREFRFRTMAETARELRM